MSKKTMIVIGDANDYSEVAILCALSLKVIFQLPFRATEGLLGSLMELMDLPLKVPDYTTLSRRQSSLDSFCPPTCCY
jgi:hypothetical protein